MGDSSSDEAHSEVFEEGSRVFTRKLHSILFTSSYIPSTNEFFDELSFFRMVICKLCRPTLCEMILKKLTIETLKKPHSSIYLMSNICTVRISLDEFLYLTKSSKCFFEICLEFFFIGTHNILLYLTLGYG